MATNINVKIENDGKVNDQEDKQKNRQENEIDDAESDVVNISELDEEWKSFVKQIVNKEPIEILEKVFSTLARSKILHEINMKNGKKKNWMESIQSRFAQYKTYCKPLLKIHYVVYEDDKKTIAKDYKEQMLDRIKPGVSCARFGTKISKCNEFCLLDGEVIRKIGKKKAFKKVCFNHIYKQENIRKSLNNALNFMREKIENELGLKLDIRCVLNSDNIDIGYIEPITSEQKIIYKCINRWINIDLVREDMYGNNIEILCHSCHDEYSAATSKQENIPDRYILMQNTSTVSSNSSTSTSRSVDIQTEEHSSLPESKNGSEQNILQSAQQAPCTNIETPNTPISGEYPAEKKNCFDNVLWAQFSRENNLVSCYPCHEYKQHISIKGKDYLAKQGYHVEQNLSNFRRAAKTHQEKEYHKIAMALWESKILPEEEIPKK